jgi:16S rRNA (adenine1518-N6/adenine1519-N6)-dimethyltransferase
VTHRIRNPRKLLQTGIGPEPENNASLATSFSPQKRNSRHTMYAMKATAELPARRPKLGQNFLTDRRAAERIVDALGDISQKTVIEIGPGRGALTRLLAQRAHHLIAIDIDRVLAAQLRMNFARYPNVEILEADILAVEFSTLLGPRPGGLTGIANPKIEQARVVGNIPYYITSDILLRLFQYHEWFDEIVLMVQLEVADRLAAKPGSRDYGLLSATAQLHATVEKLFTLPSGAFTPPPKVQSGLVRLKLEPRWEKLQVDPEAFIDFLKLSFSQKRKILLNNLKSRYDEKLIRAAIASAKLRSDVRAEAMPLEKAAAVFRALVTRADYF